MHSYLGREGFLATILQLTPVLLVMSNKWYNLVPRPLQILSRSCGEKLGEGLGSKVRHELEMVDSVSTNRYWEWPGDKATSGKFSSS